jgi:L-malate glycosyltransferase
VRILIFSHRLEYGGLVNLIDLATALRDRHAHDIVFFGAPGPLRELVESKRLRYVPAPGSRFHPSPSRMIALRKLVRDERPDIIYAWEYYQCLEAYYIEHLVHRTPLAVTRMMMSVGRILPKSVPTTYGTPQLVEEARVAGCRQVRLLLPPVDCDENAPGAADGAAFRALHGIQQDEIVIVCVSRFSTTGDIKADSLVNLIDAVAILGVELLVRLVLVGDGEIRPELERRAAAINARLSRTAVVLTGAMLDPRAAYEAADVVVGMGGSSLRALAFGKPVVVVGIAGFSAEFSPDSAEEFYRRGMFGVGTGEAARGQLAAQLRLLCSQPDRRARLGMFGRQFILDRFSLREASDELDRFLRNALHDQVQWSTAALDGIRSAAIWLRERRWSE